MENEKSLSYVAVPFPCYVPFGSMCGCNSEPEHKEDCYYFDNVQDMGAHIPTCDYHHELGYCPCDGCSKYIKKSEVSKIVREHVDGRGGIEGMSSFGKWIPCSERMPEDGQRVLATHKGGLNPDGQVIEHVFKDGEFLNNWDMDRNFKSPTFGQRYMGDVVAWMPLPEVYDERRTG